MIYRVFHRTFKKTRTELSGTLKLNQASVSLVWMCSSSCYLYCYILTMQYLKYLTGTYLLVISHLCLSPRTKTQLRKTKYREVPGLGEQLLGSREQLSAAVHLHCTRDWGIGSYTDASITDGCRGCVVFGPALSVCVWFPPQ